MGVRLTFDHNGAPAARVSTTPTRDRERVDVPVFPTRAIPVIFIPGIMGSPLRSLNAEMARWITIYSNNPWAWFPDSKYGWVAGLGKGKGYTNLEPGERKQLLDPSITQALGPYDQDIDATVRQDIGSALKRSFEHGGFKANRLMSVQEAMRRGWHTVMWETYGTVLADLEYRLRYLTYGSAPDAPGFQIPQPLRSALVEVRQSFSAALQDDFADIADDRQYNRTPLWDSLKPYLQHAGNYHYPVFAIGYNWLQSNNDSAARVYERIQEIQAYVSAPRGGADPNNHNPPTRNGHGLGLRCEDGVIIVTHSMGGLVARALANNHPDLDIRGVVHGAQPINGSATLYSRMLAGWEGVSGRYLAKTGSELVPVLANAPGGMELAPNQHYGAGWLRIRNMSHVEPTDDPRQRLRHPDVLALPTRQADGLCDPYGDIYLERDAWWKLADPAQIDPLARTEAALNKAWEDYEKVVRKAQSFHADLGTYFHPQTYLFYGNAVDQRTWGTCTWEIHHYRMLNRYNRTEVREAISAEEVNRAQGEGFPERGGNTMLSLSPKGAYPYEYLDVRFRQAEDDGDGTVPFNSGNPWKEPGPVDTNALLKKDGRPQGIRFAFEFRRWGFEHSKAYDAKNARDVTLFSVLNLIGRAS